MNTQFVIAIDGTAASGKGTLAKKLAADLGFAYLDTGKLYRYVASRLLARDIDLTNEAEAIAVAQGLNTTLKPGDLQNPDLGYDEIGQAASKIAAITGVRAALLDYQKNFALIPPNGVSGAILDGRDIGTVVYPEADLKFYINAKTEIRAQRRHKELQSKGISVTYDAALADMLERDKRDSSRATAPMKPAEDAIILDTSDMAADDVFDKVRSAVTDRLGI